MIEYNAKPDAYSEAEIKVMQVKLECIRMATATFRSDDTQEKILETARKLYSWVAE